MRSTKSLKIIDQVKIESPCHESWDKMKGSQSARHCASCVHTVRNLSALTKKQAEQVLKNRGEQRLCVRYEIKASGEIKFKESFYLGQLRQIGSVLLATVCTFLGLSTFALAEDQVSVPDTTQSPIDSVKMGELPMRMPSPSPTPSKEVMGDVAAPRIPAEIPEGTQNEIKMGKVAATE